MSEISSSPLEYLEGVILLVKMEKDCSTSLKFLDISVLVSGQLVMVAMLIASSISVNSIY